MGFDLNALAGKTAQVQVHFMGHTAIVTYDPSFLTADTMRKAGSNDDGIFGEFMTGLIKDWDLTKGKRKVPITPAGLSTVPIVFLRAVYQTVLRDSGDDSEGKASNAG